MILIEQFMLRFTNKPKQRKCQRSMIKGNVSKNRGLALSTSTCQLAIKGHQQSGQMQGC